MPIYILEKVTVGVPQETAAQVDREMRQMPKARGAKYVFLDHQVKIIDIHHNNLERSAAVMLVEMSEQAAACFNQANSGVRAYRDEVVYGVPSSVTK